MLSTRTERPETYEVYDDEGHRLGRIVRPRQTPAFGSREGTVYLRRAPLLRDRPRSRVA